MVVATTAVVAGRTAGHTAAGYCSAVVVSAADIRTALKDNLDSGHGIEIGCLRVCIEGTALQPLAEPLS
jgi:hypothetical protein